MLPLFNVCCKFSANFCFQFDSATLCYYWCFSLFQLKQVVCRCPLSLRDLNSEGFDQFWHGNFWNFMPRCSHTSKKEVDTLLRASSHTLSSSQGLHKYVWWQPSWKWNFLLPKCSKWKSVPHFSTYQAINMHRLNSPSSHCGGNNNGNKLYLCVRVLESKLARYVSLLAL